VADYLKIVNYCIMRECWETRYVQSLWRWGIFILDSFAQAASFWHVSFFGLYLIIESSMCAELDSNVDRLK
jgi:hypothetical protein